MLNNSTTTCVLVSCVSRRPKKKKDKNKKTKTKWEIKPDIVACFRLVSWRSSRTTTAQSSNQFEINQSNQFIAIRVDQSVTNRNLIRSGNFPEQTIITIQLCSQLYSSRLWEYSRYARNILIVVRNIVVSYSLENIWWLDFR